MLKNGLAMFAAMSLAAAPVVMPTSALAQPAQAESDDTSAQVQAQGTNSGNPLAAPGAGIGLALFGGVIIFIILLATGTIFDDDDGDNPATP